MNAELQTGDAPLLFVVPPLGGGRPAQRSPEGIPHKCGTTNGGRASVVRRSAFRRGAHGAGFTRGIPHKCGTTNGGRASVVRRSAFRRGAHGAGFTRGIPHKCGTTNGGRASVVRSSAFRRGVPGVAFTREAPHECGTTNEDVAPPFVVPPSGGGRTARRPPEGFRMNAERRTGDAPLSFVVPR